jgi:hypothetical protein
VAADEVLEAHARLAAQLHVSAEARSAFLELGGAGHRRQGQRVLWLIQVLPQVWRSSTAV